MNRKPIVTCAITGAGDTVGKSSEVPVTPAQIAASALEAAEAGAAIVHCHVRDEETGKGTRKVALYEEVVERIRDKNKKLSLISPQAWAATLMSGQMTIQWTGNQALIWLEDVSD